MRHDAAPGNLVSCSSHLVLQCHNDSAGWPILNKEQPDRSQRPNKKFIWEEKLTFKGLGMTCNEGGVLTCRYTTQ